jgi:ubiquinone/menaquinone biosynthesis C-methylase UbiE
MSATFCGHIPQNYDQGLGPVFFVGYARTMAQEVVAAPSKFVLETACGTGIVTWALRDALPRDAHLMATDINPDMLKIAQTKFQPEEHLSFQQADGTALPFQDAAFDTAVCQYGVMFYPDKAKGYAEAHRVLAPGGRYLFSVWDEHRHNGTGRIAHEVVSSFFPDNPPGFFLMSYSYGQIDPIKDALLEAGLDDIVVSIVRQDCGIQDFPAFTRGLIDLWDAGLRPDRGTRRRSGSDTGRRDRGDAEGIWRRASGAIDAGDLLGGTQAVAS